MKLRHVQHDYTTNRDLQIEAYRLNIPLHFTYFQDYFNHAKKDGGYIINLAESHMPGTHWVCLYKEGKNHAYFDSYGFPPTQAVRQVVQGALLYNSSQIQGIDQGKCGLYCIEFIEYMFRHKHIPFKTRFQTWLNTFSYSFKKNQSTLLDLSQN
jgi:hypothetical protein